MGCPDGQVLCPSLDSDLPPIRGYVTRGSRRCLPQIGWRAGTLERMRVGHLGSCMPIRLAPVGKATMRFSERIRLRREGLLSHQ